MAESSGIGGMSNVSGPATDSLKGRVALVTGGSRGIGKAIALELARDGATVAFSYNSNLAKAEETVAEIHAMGVKCLILQGDVAHKEEARRIVSSTLETFKRLDILVNNAGITRDRTMKKMTDEDWEAVISVNLNGTYYCAAAALPAMIEQKYGRIINIASIVGETGAFGQSNYAASKGGIIAGHRLLGRLDPGRAGALVLRPAHRNPAILGGCNPRRDLAPRARAHPNLLAVPSHGAPP